jgi:hypothetical protein
MPSNHELRREHVISECIRAGKFNKARAPFWEKEYDRDPAGTERTLTALVSVTEGAPPYPPELFPHLSQRRRPQVHSASVAATAPPPAPAEAGDEQVEAWTRQLFPETRATRGRIVRCND